ncbi:MAG: hypothetical protein JW917_00755 [Ignavibacteria bacterium]|nr:hypothetical protein [Ignavibacteria bacterium]
MGKKLILVLIALFIGGFIVIQSCNESPLMSPEPLGEKLYPGNEIYANNGISTPRFFAGINDGKPKMCPGLTDKLELWAAGGTIHVGYIEFYSSQITGNIKVRFIFDVNPFPDNFAVERISFHIGDVLTDIPVDDVNKYPDYANFVLDEVFSPAFSPTSSQPYKEFEYTVPTDENQDGYYIAAHVWVCKYGGVEGFNFNLPNDPVNYQVNYNSPSSYFKVNFLNGTGGILGTGPYEGFCVDADLNIFPPATLTGHIYSTYEYLPTALQNAVEHWENLDLVNWIINYYPVGSSVPQYSYSIPWTSAEWPFEGNFTSLGTNGTVVWEDLQAAIWGLLEEDPVYNAWRYLPNLTNRNTNQANAWGIIYAALTTPGAEGFLPGCEQKVTAILVPDEGNIQIITVQPTIIQLEIPCQGCCNHTWGDGQSGANFPNCASWATYFRWNYSCPTR